jgi:hypothetical protein
MNLNQIIIQQKRDDKRYRKYAERQFYRALREQVMPVMDNPNATVQVQPMFDAYNRVYQYTGIDSAKKEYRRIKKQEGQKDSVIDLLLNTWSEWMRGYVIQNLGQMIQRVSNNTQDAINRALQDSLELGETRRQTVKRIYDYTLGEIGRSRARMIARTETTRATNVGKRKSADDWSLFNQGVQMYKKWIHVPTPEFREFHLELANDKPIPQDQAWQVRNPKGGFNSMLMPGDASAPGNQTINCNCTTIYMSERFAQRNFGIDKSDILAYELKAKTYTDYPESATNNAKRALKWADENGWGTCGTPVGKARARQLANREPLTRNTIARMASFKRHQQYADVPYSEGCGGLMWDAWGGTSGVEWAIRKLKEIDG